MEKKRIKHDSHDSYGRFAGHPRVNVEDVPRLPGFPAAWTLADPRGRAYCLFWTSQQNDHEVVHALRMAAMAQGAAVEVTLPEVGSFRIGVVRRPLPRRGGFAVLYRCPGCAKPRRYLYLQRLVLGRLVDSEGPLCQACAGLRWASQGRYLGNSERALRGLAGVRRLPDSRYPWDPRAVSDPRLILDDFPDLVRRP